MSKKIITVFGSTGTQGGSVVDIFLNDPKLSAGWQVRGVTRDIQKDKAKALAARGVEMVTVSYPSLPPFCYSQCILPTSIPTRISVAH